MMLMPMNIMIVLLPSSAACCAQPVGERSRGVHWRSHEVSHERLSGSPQNCMCIGLLFWPGWRASCLQQNRDCRAFALQLHSITIVLL